MVTKRCQWGQCNSDSRYKHKDYMKDVFFIPFPKPHISMTKCLEWIKKCGRPHEQLNPEKIDKYKYVCSKVSVLSCMKTLKILENYQNFRTFRTYYFIILF